jgi:hypothetical protein
MNGKFWFKVYNDLPNNPKYFGLTYAQRSLFVEYLCIWNAELAQKNTASSKIAFILRRKPKEVERDMAELVKANLILNDGTPKGWDERQQGLETSADRMRRLRERRKREPVKEPRGRDATGDVTGDVTSDAQRRKEKKREEKTEGPCGPVSPLQGENNALGDAVPDLPGEPENPPPIEPPGADDYVGAELEPPITEAEAVWYGERVGLTREASVECWNYWVGRDWIPPRANFRMSRAAAKAQLANWKTNRAVFAARDAKAGGYQLRTEVPVEDTRPDIHAVPTALRPATSAKEMYGGEDPNAGLEE